MKWDMVKFGDVCSIISGFAFDSSFFNSENRGTPLIRIRNVLSGLSSTYTTEDVDPKYIVHKKDLLIGMDGEFNIAEWKSDEAALNQRVCKIITNAKKCDKRYLLYFLPKALKHIESKTSFVTVKHLSVKQIKDIYIPLPALPEQKRIAAILDKANSIRQQRQESLALMDTFIKSVFLDMFGDPVTNPMGWEKHPLHKYNTIITGNTPPRANKKNYGNDLEWIKSDNINTPFTFLTEAAELLSKEGAQKARVVHKGAILMTCIAGSIKCIGNVAIADRSVSFNQQINAIVPKVSPSFFLYWHSILSQRELQSSVKKSLKGIVSKRQLEVFSYINPPIELQNKFAVIVHKVEAQKTIMRQQLREAENTFKSLQQQFFG